MVKVNCSSRPFVFFQGFSSCCIRRGSKYLAKNFSETEEEKLEKALPLVRGPTVLQHLNWFLVVIRLLGLGMPTVFCRFVQLCCTADHQKKLHAGGHGSCQTNRVAVSFLQS